MKKSLILLSLITLFTTLNFGCRKEDPVVEDPISDLLKAHFHHHWGSDDFSYDTVYNVGGVDITIQELRYYLSDFHIHDDGSGHQEFMNQALLIDAGATGTATIGKLELNHVHEIEYLLGLNETINHQDPTTAEAPLDDFTMHWSWNPDAGYKFIKIQGQRDKDGTGTWESFEIHCATDNLAREMTNDAHVDLANHVLTLSFVVDYEKFFTGVDFSAETLDGTHGDGILTNQIADNVANGAIADE
jgi:hypothetical protein